jgi:hypothetical protein
MFYETDNCREAGMIATNKCMSYHGADVIRPEATDMGIMEKITGLRNYAQELMRRRRERALARSIVSESIKHGLKTLTSAIVGSVKGETIASIKPDRPDHEDLRLARALIKSIDNDLNR